MRLVFQYTRGEIDRALRELQEPIAAAATGAVADAGEAAVLEGRVSIASAGFSSKWQGLLGSKVYPQGRNSMRPAAHITHKIPYAGIFEDGGKIDGPVYLPIGDNVPKASTGRRLTPKQFIAQGGELHSVKGRGKPLLVGRLSKAKGEKFIPMFHGLDAVTMGKKFRIKEAVQRAAARLGEFYLNRIRSS